MQKNKFKLYIFIGAALIAVLGLYFFSNKTQSTTNNQDQVSLTNTSNQQTTIQSVNSDGKVFGDWRISCTKAENDKKETCIAAQTISIKQEKEDVPVATYQFFYNDKKELKFVQILPQGLLLQPGTKTIAGEKMIASGKFTVCQNGGCVAVSDVTESEIQTIISSDKVAVGFLGADGKQVNLNLSPKGLKEAISSIK
jgi:invasion protein IalB